VHRIQHEADDVLVVDDLKRKVERDARGNGRELQRIAVRGPAHLLHHGVDDVGMREGGTERLPLFVHQQVRLDRHVGGELVIGAMSGPGNALRERQEQLPVVQLLDEQGNVSPEAAACSQDNIGEIAKWVQGRRARTIPSSIGE
jgi:hypothetical protein